MIEKICAYLTRQIQKEDPQIDHDRAEAIEYGIQLILGEIPKIFLLFALGFILKMGWLTIFAFFILLPYRVFSGGFHLKTHIGCIVGTIAIYLGNVMISSYVTWQPMYIKYVFAFAIWIFSLAMIRKYAPADTSNVPILSTKERKRKKVMSYITATIMIILACILPNQAMANILLFGTLTQSMFITRIAYKITKNEYGYETYIKQEAQSIKG